VLAIRIKRLFCPLVAQGDCNIPKFHYKVEIPYKGSWQPSTKHQEATLTGSKCCILNNLKFLFCYSSVTTVGHKKKAHINSIVELREK
jgi:hypothetical protein